MHSRSYGYQHHPTHTNHHPAHQHNHHQIFIVEPNEEKINHSKKE